MKIVIKFVFLSLLVLSVSCATRIKTKYNKDINFRNYKTYALIPQPEKKSEYLTDPERVKLKVDEKVTKALKYQLKKRNYEESSTHRIF